MREILVLIMISSYNRPSVRSTFHVSLQYAKCHTATTCVFWWEVSQVGARNFRFWREATWPALRFSKTSKTFEDNQQIVF